VVAIDAKIIETFGNKELNACEGFAYKNEDDCNKRKDPVYWIKGNWMKSITAYPLIPDQGVVKKKQ